MRLERLREHIAQGPDEGISTRQVFPMKAYRIPNCCAMPLNGTPGQVYDCLTCHTRYRYLDGWDWVLDGPLVELGAEQWPPDHMPELDEHERRL